jgi:Na+/H+-dicarboxylate symporter
MVSYHIGRFIHTLDLSINQPEGIQGLTALWTFSLPKLIANDRAMLAGIILGVLSSFAPYNIGTKLSGYFEKAVTLILRFLLIIVPVFVFGLVVKLIHDKTLGYIVRDYSLIFAIVALSLFSYITLLYLIACRFKISPFLTSIKNMLTPAFTALSSMSSAAAMPLTLKADEKNVENQALGRLAIPLTVSTHLIGDCFAIPIFAFAVMKNFGVPDPDFLSYLLFAFYFVVAKFSVAPIPGGGIIVMIPVLESYLGFNGEMSSLITALYILFDPVITCGNVYGNGAFALLLGKSKYAECTLQKKS